MSHDPFTRERLAALQAKLDAEIPKRTIEETLILATWNMAVAL